MSEGMPYQLEKGPFFSVVESMLERGYSIPARLALLEQMVQQLAADVPPDNLPTLDSTTLNRPNRGSAEQQRRERRRHMNEEWFGKRPNRAGTGWDAQAPFDPANPTTTGYWYQWYGDAERIVGTTFIRAVEVSLGIDRTSAETDFEALQPKHLWPIEIFWRCPAPWMEGWVTWRRELNGSGHVTVHLHTPSHHGSALLLSPFRNPPRDTWPDYDDDPTSSTAARGMWVIAHKQQEHINDYDTTTGTEVGSGRLPSFGPLVHSFGDIVTVQPNEPDGGVRGVGRVYTP
jgi:hypothetical protein